MHIQLSSQPFLCEFCLNKLIMFLVELQDSHSEAITF